MDILTQRIKSLTIPPNEPTHVLFNPTGEKAWLRDTFDKIPRYLFRTFLPGMAGENTSEWMKSFDAAEGNTQACQDLLARDDGEIALMLNEHIRWDYELTNGDGFTSWTTSLLYSLHYAIYKHKKRNIHLSEIRLCVVDTTCFPQGVFLRDLDLIEAYKDKGPKGGMIQILGELHSWAHRGLPNLLDLRQEVWARGYYYFGEYLSQGQLKIKGGSYTIECHKIINSNLYQLCPSFKEKMEQPATGTDTWLIKNVMELRQDFYGTNTAVQTKPKEIDAVIDIVNGFDPRWRLPMAANLLGFRPRQNRDGAILYVFRKNLTGQLFHSPR
jgi:hypothetical protein